MDTVVSKLRDLGAEFILPLEKIKEKLDTIHIFLFDWDGVFNSGQKFGRDQGSPFAEPDSMGINLLKLAYYLEYGRLPFTGIITGAHNPSAKYFVEREHMNVCIRGFTDKKKAWEVLTEQFKIEPDAVAFVYDDVLDLPIAEKAALRFCVRREASPAFQQFVVEQRLCDYVTAKTGRNHAVREICELLLTINDSYSDVLNVRRECGQTYQEYLELRNRIEPLILQP